MDKIVTKESLEGLVAVIKEQLDEIRTSIVPVISINTISTTETPYSTKAALQTALGVSADDLEKILAGDCILRMGNFKFTNVGGSPNMDWSSFGMVEYSSITNDWDLGYWYANDIAIIGGDSSGYGIVVKRNVQLTTTTS